MSTSDAADAGRGSPPDAGAGAVPKEAGHGQPGAASAGHGSPGYGTPGYGPPGYGYGPPSGYPPGYPGGYPPGYPPVAPWGRPTNSLAIVSLVLAFVFAPAALVTGIIARKQIRRTGEDGDGMALAGIIIGGIITGLFVLVIVFWIIAFASFAGDPAFVD